LSVTCICMEGLTSRMALRHNLRTQSHLTVNIFALGSGLD